VLDSLEENGFTRIPPFRPIGCRQYASHYDDERAPDLFAIDVEPCDVTVRYLDERIEVERATSSPDDAGRNIIVRRTETYDIDTPDDQIIDAVLQELLQSLPVTSVEK
jgi:hypothetical protein